jgi:hypothetical protein
MEATQQHVDLSKNRSIYSYERPNFIREGDLAIFYESMELNKQVVIRKGGKYQMTKGVILHDELID